MTTNVGDYLRLLLSRWPLILLIVLLSMGVGLAHFLLTPKQYRSRTTLQIEQRSLLSISGDANPWLDAWAGMKYYPTQYRLLKSRGLAERVVLNLQLAEDPIFNPGGSLAEIDDATIARLAGRLQAGLAVDPVVQTELVELSFVAPDAELAARIVDGVADAFIDWRIEARTKNVDRASSFLEEQIDRLKEQIDEKEQQLQDYGRDTDIVNLDPESNAMLGRLARLNESLTEAIGQRLEKEARHQTLLSTPASALVDSNPSPLVADLHRELLQLERDYETKLKVYKPDWPEMLELRSRIDEARQKLDGVVRDQAESIRRQAYADYQSALRRERSLEQQIQQAREAALDIGSAAVEYRNLEMEITNRRELLDDLLKKYSEAGMSARLQNTRESNIRVIDRALVPRSPFRPSLRTDLSTGLAVGLTLGIGLVLLIHFLDRTVKSSEELEQLIGVPVLAVIPDIHEGGKGSRYGGYYGYGRIYGGRKKARERASEPPEEVEIELLPERRPRIAVSEAYRSLRTGLLLSSAERLKVVSVTSAQASEGKTATAANLAVVMAQMGRRVLLLDADLRKPRLHKVFKASNRAGLVNFLTGSHEPDALFKPTEIANLYLCPSGPHPPNPSELLASDRMVEILQIARQRFDFTIIDTPPVLAVTDAIMPGTISDGVILCFRANEVLREDAKACVDRLQMADARILGAVLNRYRPLRAGSYGRRYYYYESYAEAADEAAVDSAA